MFVSVILIFKIIENLNIYRIINSDRENNCNIYMKNSIGDSMQSIQITVTQKCYKFIAIEW